MPSDSTTSVTTLLVRWRDGDREALEQLMPLVYDELRRLARHHLRRERSDHTLQSTALVHEAYLRLAEQNPPQWQNRAHFCDRSTGHAADPCGTCACRGAARRRRLRLRSMSRSIYRNSESPASSRSQGPHGTFRTR